MQEVGIWGARKQQTKAAVDPCGTSEQSWPHPAYMTKPSSLHDQIIISNFQKPSSSLVA